MEDLGRLVLLDHVLTGNNLQQYGSHLSQVDQEQARVLLHNQRDQMRQRLRNAMLAAYGISTSTPTLLTPRTNSSSTLSRSIPPDTATTGWGKLRRCPGASVFAGAGAPVPGASPV